MSFDEFLKMKEPMQQLRILIHKNAWRKHAYEQGKATKQAIRFDEGPDGVRLAELMNPIPESL